MSRFSPWGVALLVFALVVARGAAQNKDKKDDPKKTDVKPPTVPDKKDAEKKLLKTSTLVGEVTHIEPNKQAFRIKVEYKYSELNQGEYNALIQSQIQLGRLAPNDVQGRINTLRDIANHQARLYQIKTTHKDFAIDAAEGMKVRLPTPKASFDDMGNVKKFTAKELAALRGKDKMFDGEFSDITNGQIVQVTIVLPKPQQKPMKKDDIVLKEEEKIEATNVAVLRNPVPGK